MESILYSLKSNTQLSAEEVAKIAHGLKTLAAHAYLNCSCAQKSKPEKVDNAVEQGLQAIDRLFN